MGNTLATHYVVLDAVVANDVRKFRAAFRETELNPLFLAKSLTPDDLLPPARSPAFPLRNIPADWQFASVLHIVAERSDTRLLAAVLQVLTTHATFDKALLSRRDSAGLTPLSRAVKANSALGVVLLAKAGANLDEPFMVSSPLNSASASASYVRYAAHNNLPDVLSGLLQQGADTVSWGSDGRRPLHLAVERGHLDCVKILLLHDATYDGIELEPSKAKPEVQPDSAPSKRIPRLSLRRFSLPSIATSIATKPPSASTSRRPFTPPQQPTPPGMAVTNRLRAVERYIVRECVQSPPEDSSSTENDDNPTPDDGAPGDILTALHSALRDAFRGQSASTSAVSYRLNRDRGASLLHLSCSYSQPKVLQYLLSLDQFSATVNDMNDSGKSALYMAVRFSSLECVKLLIQAGADVHTKDIENWTPLHEAVKAGDKCHEILKCLVNEHSCDVNAMDDDGWNSLHVAARFSSNLAVELLINAGANVNAMTEDRETPMLLAAAQQGSAGVLRQLLKHGADVTLHHDAVLTPSRLILGRKDFTQLSILLDHLLTLAPESRKKAIDFDSQSDSGDSLLHLLVLENAETASKLVAVGADPDTKNHDGVAPLHLIAKMGSASLTESLLEAGADQNIERGDGLVPLHIAADSGHVDVVKTLLSYGADVNFEVTHNGRYRGFTPLMFASRLGKPEVLRYLIGAGADLDTAKGDGFTSLHLAALNGNTDVCRVLIQCGANYRVADESGYYPMQLATRHNQFEVVSALLESKVEADSCGMLGMTSLHIAAFICEARLMWLLIRGGADVNTANRDLTTPLHVAAGRDNGRVGMQVLLANGAQIDVVDKEYDTPLHSTCYRGLYQNARLLLRRGATVSPPNGRLSTPLHLAASVGSEATVETLLRHGADVDAKDRSGRTAYRVAAEQGHRKAMILLFRSMAISLEEIAPLEDFASDETTADGEELLCVICQTRISVGDKVRELPCQHTYHDECIIAWFGGENLSRHDWCPLCQASVLPDMSNLDTFSGL